MIPRRDVRARLASRHELSPTCFALELSSATPFEAVPGQFGMLACGCDLDPFLRRPFSFAGVRAHDTGTTIEIIVKEVGKGSRALRHLAPGNELSLLAPLGKGFSLEPSGGAPWALVAGGIGLPPVLFAAEVLARRGVTFDVFVGASTADELLLVERCGAAASAGGGEAVLTTDDGSRGERGLVTAALARRLAAGRRYGKVLGCGPTLMLAALTQLAREERVEAEISLEEPMACGVGVCLGCVVESAAGRRVATCREGPVFRVAELAERWWA